MLTIPMCTNIIADIIILSGISKLNVYVDTCILSTSKSKTKSTTE